MIAWFVRHRVPAQLLTLLLLVGGLWAAPNLQREVIPAIKLQRVQVTVAYPGAGPEEIQSGLLIPLENAITEVNGVARTVSLGLEGVGIVVAEIDPKLDVRPVMEAIDSRVKSVVDLPEGAESPHIAELLLEMPAIYLTVYGAVDERTLKTLGTRVRDEVLSLPSVTRAKLANVRADEIAIELSEAAMTEYGISFDLVAEMIRRSSLDVPAGELHTATGGVLLRTNSKARTAEELSNIELVAGPDGSRVVVGDVADVTDGFADTDRSVRFDGQPAVTVQVVRVGDQDIVEVTDAVKQYAAELRPQLPAGIQVALWRDFSNLYRSRVDTLVRNGLQGMCLVFLALMLFMRPRVGFWVTVGIVLTFMGTLLGMYLLGVSLNMVTLFGFLLVLGTLVDDGIVVGEAIFVEHERGLSGPEAAIVGTRRVFWPILVAVLTNILTFAPLMFLPGVQAQIWAFVPMIVVIAYVVSLFESMLCLPEHLSGLKPERPDARRLVWLTRVQKTVADSLSRFASQIYQPALLKALTWRWATLAGFVGIMVLTLGLLIGGKVKIVFFPLVAADSVIIDITLQGGVPVSETEAAVREVETRLRWVAERVDNGAGLDDEPTIRHLMRSIGEASDGLGIRVREGTNAAQLFVELSPSEHRKVDTPTLIEHWREAVEGVPYVTSINFDYSLNRPGADIEVALSSRDDEILAAAAAALKERLGRYPGVHEVSDSERPPRDEIQFSLRNEAQALGLTSLDLARQVRQGFLGETVQTIQRGREEVPVVIRYDANSRRSQSALEAMQVRTRDGVAIPLANAAVLKSDKTSTSVTRVNQRRTNIISANVNRDEGNTYRILDDLKLNYLPELLREYPGLHWGFIGAQQEQGDVIRGLILYGGAAILLVFCAISILFRSYVQTLVVFGVLPFAIVGAIFAHFVFGLTLSMLSFAGIVAALGVCVNDSVVLIDYINRARREGMSRDEAIRTAGVLRFRPIVLTTLTTFVGLSTLLMERSTQAQVLIPMATSLAWAVLVTTFIALFLVPVLVSLVWVDTPELQGDPA